MNTTPVDSTSAPPAPDRVAPRNSVLCPLCEYDLRGLADPRCPECGYSFTWEELADPARRFHPYLFEHHPRRNAWSFFQTLTRGLAPSRFWSRLYPTQPSRPKRLLAYWLFCALPLAAAAGGYGLVIVEGLMTSMAPWLAQPWNRLEWDRAAVWVANWDIQGGGLTLVSLMCLLWPWLTAAALLVFQVSLRRANLKTAHVLRCVLYAGDACFWLAFPLALALLFAWANQRWPPHNYLGPFAPLLPLALLFWMGYRLWCAYRLYLRFDHALATVIASQAMVGLVYVKLLYMARGL